MTMRSVRLMALLSTAVAAVWFHSFPPDNFPLAEARLDAQGARGRGGAPVPQSNVPDVEWRTYGSDLASTRYSPLDQINALRLPGQPQAPR